MPLGIDYKLPVNCFQKSSADFSRVNFSLAKFPTANFRGQTEPTSYKIDYTIRTVVEEIAQKCSFAKFRSIFLCPILIFLYDTAVVSPIAYFDCIRNI